MGFEMTLRAAIDVINSGAAVFGLFGDEMMWACFFLGLQLSALMKYEGLVEQRK